MAFPASFIDEVVARNPIEDVVGQHVNLKRSGANMFGLCPFHGEKTASFSVAPDKGIYYCFGCHKGGGVINFQMEIEGLSYPDAVRALAQRVGMTPANLSILKAGTVSRSGFGPCIKKPPAFSTVSFTHRAAKLRWSMPWAEVCPKQR